MINKEKIEIYSNKSSNDYNYFYNTEQIYFINFLNIFYVKDNIIINYLTKNID